LWIRERNVDEDTLHDDEHASTVDGDTDRRHDPVDGSPCRPAKQEETDGGAEAAEQSRNKSGFLGAKTVLHDIQDEVLGEICTIDRNTNETGD